MKTPIVDRHEVRTTSLTFPLTVRDKQRILMCARKEGLTMSAFVRRLVRKALYKYEKGNYDND